MSIIIGLYLSHIWMTDHSLSFFCLSIYIFLSSWPGSHPPLSAYVIIVYVLARQCLSHYRQNSLA